MQRSAYHCQKLVASAFGRSDFSFLSRPLNLQITKPELNLNLQGIDSRLLHALLKLEQQKGWDCYGNGLWSTDVLHR